MPPARSSSPHRHCFIQWLNVVAGRLYHQGKWLCNYLCLLWRASNSTTCGFLLVCTLPTTPYVWPSMSKSFTLEISGWPFLFFMYPKEEILCYQVVLRLVSAREETASQRSLSRSSSRTRWMNAGPMLTPEQALTSCLQYHCSGEVYPWHVQVPCAETSISLYFKGVWSWGKK